MELLNVFKKNQATVNCQEAFSIWDLLSANYQFIEKLNIWRNFTHDKDLHLILNNLDKNLRKMLKSIEDKAKEFSLSGPDVGVKDVKTDANTEVIRDELIAQDVLIWLQGIMELSLRSLRTTTTNDDLRKLFITIIHSNLDIMNNMIGYLRIKGWINVPLKYPNIPKKTNEIIDTSEAFHLWDHLTFRYDNVLQTEIFKDLVRDVDLKILITIGLQKTLKKQAVILEKELLHFGVPLPKKPANIVAWPSEASSFISDDYIYRNIYIGLIGATLIHIAAVKQSLTNDRIRKIFIDLLIEEVKIEDRFIVYGKMKGYLNEPPKYKLQ